MIALLDFPDVKIRMHADSQVEFDKRLKACAKEPETVEWIRSFEPNSVFLDVGANTGSYSLIAAMLGHMVIAVEASTPNYERLLQNADLNELSPNEMVCVPVPLWSHQENVSFCYSSREPGAALHSVNGSGPDREMKPAFPLDYWCFECPQMRWPQPRYIKLDVDGCEVEVIQGAVQTLRGVQELLVEVDAASPSSEKIEPILVTLGFRVKSIHPHGDSPVSNVIFERSSI